MVAVETVTPLLSLKDIEAGYRRRSVIYDVSMHVDPGEIVSLFGHNGAGKTTTVKAAFGVIRPARGTVMLGEDDVTSATCQRHVQLRMSYTPAERFVFAGMTIEANLRLGGRSIEDRVERQRRLGWTYERFPLLRGISSQLAGTLSGGQQRILSIGMAMMSRPRLLLLDEPSLGVSPFVAQEILSVLRQYVDEEGSAVLLLEQNVGLALHGADRVYVMRSGRVILEESAEEMRKRPHYWDLF